MLNLLRRWSDVSWRGVFGSSSCFWGWTPTLLLRKMGLEMRCPRSVDTDSKDARAGSGDTVGLRSKSSDADRGYASTDAMAACNDGLLESISLRLSIASDPGWWKR